MIRLVHVPAPPRREPLTRANLRRVAIGIVNARRGEILGIHADRDGCLVALVVSVMLTTTGRRFLPRSIVEDWHRRVSAPASRDALRHPDRIPAH